MAICQYLMGGNLLFPLTSCSFSSSSPIQTPLHGQSCGLHCWGHIVRSWAFGVVFLHESLLLSPHCRLPACRVGTGRGHPLPAPECSGLPHPPPTMEAGVSESSGLGQRFCILLSSEEFSGRKQNAPPVKMQPPSLYIKCSSRSPGVRRHILLL